MVNKNRLKIKILKQKLEEVSGKKVMFEDTTDIATRFAKNAPSNRGGTTNEVIKQLNILKQALNPEGWKILETFMKGATGMNRYWTIKSLSDLYSGKIASITKGTLQSYTNKVLFGLLETGDLIQKQKGVIIPSKTVSSEDTNVQFEEEILKVCKTYGNIPNEELIKSLVSVIKKLS